MKETVSVSLVQTLIQNCWEWTAHTVLITTLLITIKLVILSALNYKGLCFHYGLLLKKTIFKSSLLSYFPNYPGLWEGEGLYHPTHVKVCLPQDFILGKLTVWDIYVKHCVLYKSFGSTTSHSVWKFTVHSNDFVQFWSTWTLQKWIGAVQMRNANSGGRCKKLNLWAHKQSVEEVLELPQLILLLPLEF